MNNRTLCLDFDGVIHGYTSGWKGPRAIPDPPVPGAIEFIYRALNSGWDVAVHSSRSAYWFGRFAMRSYLYKHAGPGYWWPEPGTRGLEDVQFPRHKPAAFITIDDLALTFTGDWKMFHLDDLSHFKPWNKR